MRPQRRDYTDHGECQACYEGDLWWTPGPDRFPVWLCADHETIIAGQPGWEREQEPRVGEVVRDLERLRARATP